MLLECKTKNELADPTRALIKKLWKVHNEGGTIPLNFLFNLFSGLGQLPLVLQEQLAERDDIKIDKTQSNAGRFKNVGPKRIKEDLGQFDIKIPKEIRGDYISFKNECRFVFDSDATIKGGKFL